MAYRVSPLVVNRISVESNFIFANWYDAICPACCRRALPINLPRARPLDRFGVYPLPFRKFIEECDLILVRLSMSRQRDTEKKISILAYDVHQQRNDRRGFLVSMFHQQRPVVVPMTDACFSLPGLFLKSIRHPNSKSRVSVPQIGSGNFFQIDHSFQTPAMRLHILVVVIGHDLWRQIEGFLAIPSNPGPTVRHRRR